MIGAAWGLVVDLFIEGGTGGVGDFARGLEGVGAGEVLRELVEAVLLVGFELKGHGTPNSEFRVGDRGGSIQLLTNCR